MSVRGKRQKGMLAALSVMLRDCGPSPCCRCRQPAPAGTPCALSRLTVWLTPVSVLSWLHAQAACTINDPQLALCLLPIMLRDAALSQTQPDCILQAACTQPEARTALLILLYGSALPQSIVI